MLLDDLKLHLLVGVECDLKGELVFVHLGIKSLDMLVFKLSL